MGARDISRGGAGFAAVNVSIISQDMPENGFLPQTPARVLRPWARLAVAVLQLVKKKLDYCKGGETIRGHIVPCPPLLTVYEFMSRQNLSLLFSPHIDQQEQSDNTLQSFPHATYLMSDMMYYNFLHLGRGVEVYCWGGLPLQKMTKGCNWLCPKRF